jgi:hypothetical protein
LVRFHRVGQTAAYAAFARGPDGTATKLEAVLALLSRLDPDDDHKTLDALHRNPNLSNIDPTDWSAARSQTGPTAAAFFTDEQALNDALIHGLMSLAGAAFFDRLGLLE